MGINILLVDDSKSALFMFEKIINLSGIDLGEIRKAANGREAISVLEGFAQCSLVMTDLNMPEMNGLELIEKLKENPVTRPIPIIVISTEGRDEFLQKAMESGAAASLRKPSRPEEIKEIILRTLGVKEDESKIKVSFGSDF